MKKHTLLIPSLILWLCICGSAVAATDRPNVILILADDLGYEALGINGAE